MFGIRVGFRSNAILSTKVPGKFAAKVVAPQECGFATNDENFKLLSLKDLVR
jgi:hypothetical protein